MPPIFDLGPPPLVFPKPAIIRPATEDRAPLVLALLAHQMRRAGGGGCSCTPSYVTGDRTASITVTTTLPGAVGGGTPSNLVDGDFGANSTDAMDMANGHAVSGLYIRFQYGVSTKITEAKWYQQNTASLGTWKWQGSNDASAWTDIGSQFTLGGATTQTQTELSTNTNGYLYYQLIGVSGNWASGAARPFILEVEFNQCAC